jgi:hypothetical protein
MHTLTVKWTPSTDKVDGYNVYTNGYKAGLTTVNNNVLIVSNSYVVTVPSPGIYYFSVTAVENGVESLHSPLVQGIAYPYDPATTWYQKLYNVIWLWMCEHM